ncbi:MAG: polyprenyl synthetase family protein [Thermodesulfobacteriota bacterium]
MDIEKYLGEKMRFVNDALDRLLPPETDYPQNLFKAMRYSVFAGGKRFRPALVLAANEAVGGSPEECVNTACAFECVHTYSLIHDDLPGMDNDDLRRGRPSCHKAFGEATAILAGDALLTLAFELVAKTPSIAAGYPSKGWVERIIRVIREISGAAGCAGMVNGQMVDIESEGKEVSFPVLEHIHIHKTGALIASAVRCGAILGNAGEKDLEDLTHYAASIGLAFQIADDILDVEGSAGELGKPVGSDEKRKKATYPSIVGLKESKEMARELIERALSSVERFGKKAEPLKAMALYIVERRK